MTTRIRERSLQDPVVSSATMNHELRGQYNPQWNVQPSTTITTNGPSAAEYMEDEVTPGYRRYSRGGGIVNKPLHHRITTVTPPPVVPLVANRTYLLSWTDPVTNVWTDYECGAKWYGDIVPFASDSTSPYPFIGLGTDSVAEAQRIQELAVTEAYANIDESEMLALATMAEARKTTDFLANTMKRVAQVARRARKLDLKALKGTVSKRELQDRYMELRYAVRPMLYDVDGVVKALQKANGTKLRRTYRGKQQSTLSANDVLVDQSFYGGIAKADVTRMTKKTITARAGVLCDVDISVIQRFGGDKLLESAWELVPFSFMVDWVANVGKTIGAWTPNAGVNRLTSWVVIRETSITRNSVGNIRSAMVPWPREVRNDLTCPGFTYGIVTEMTNRYPVPPLSMRPRLDINLNAYKLTDMAIILKKIFR